MKYFAHIDDNSMLQGWYTDDIHETIPEPNIEVAKEQWELATSSGHNFVAADGSSSFMDTRTTEELALDARLRREGALEFEVDPFVSNPLRWESLSEAEQAEVRTYRQALLDVTDQSGFPSNISWPSKPSVLYQVQKRRDNNEIKLTVLEN